ncbi:MAG TPA: hypothetical protein VJO35_10990 [Terriglobales bacterium]|nr:hypothetical protein [Terriglobales bacterium]
MSSRISLFVLTVSLITGGLGFAQTNPAKTFTLDDNFVHQQFGDTCSLEAAWPPMVADMNGDGIDDLVMVAHCKNPLVDQGDKDYRVVDPMDSFYGYGNPKITTGFAPDDPKLRGGCVLIIHGAGPEAWRSATPLAKFVIINLPIKTITVKRMKMKKNKVVSAIYVEEAGGDEMTSAIFWDGHKYRYNPLGSSME